MLIGVQFRGLAVDVVIDSWDDDPDMNSLTIEWHFVDPALQETDDEAHTIFCQLAQAVYDRDDPFD
jgi:hypothetical protein